MIDKTTKMNGINAVLLILTNLLCSSVDAVDVAGISGSGGGDDTTDKVSSKSKNDDSLLHQSGGLRWQDLAVSFEKCPLTTALVLDKYKYDNYHDDYYNQHCLDDSVWLLHPSSGFVENGSLCGIIGPSGAGKSTLLSALGGTTPRSSGVFLTGSVWYEECLLENSPSNSRYHLSQQEGDIAMLSQHDNFFDMLTPREALEFAAYLESQKQKSKHTNTGDDTSNKKNGDHREIAERKLAVLGLMGVADRRIGDRTKINGGGGSSPLWLHKMMRGLSKVRGGGGLSGGERRRLSVALELITEPKIFLADEPTTGLDSSQAEKVVKLISTLAKERNVPSLCTLHQPKSSIWRTLDQVILLAPGGKMCYAGDRKNATTYFKHIGYECPSDTNPAEYFIDLVTIDTDDPAQGLIDETRINWLHHQFLHSCITDNIWPSPSSEERDIIKHQTHTNRDITNSGTDGRFPSLSSLLRNKLRGVANTANRFGALLLRSWRQNVRDTNTILLRLGASVLQAGLFASIFPSVRDGKSLPKSIADRVALLSFGVINMSIMALMKTLVLFANERSVVVREQMRCDYYSLEYLLAKVVAEIPLDTSFAMVFAVVLKRLTGLRTSTATLIKTYCLMTVSSVSLGFAIGSVASSVETAMSLGMPIMVIFMVVGIINPSGVDPDSPPNRIMQWLKVASPIKWAIEALLTSEFRGMVFELNDRGIWGKLEDLPRMGALSMVDNGDNVLTNLGLGTAKYSDLMEKLAILSGVYLLMSWLGLSYFGPSFIDTEIVQ